MAWPFTGNNGLIEKVYLPYFYKTGEAAIPFFVNGIISRQAFLSAYKDFPPIEEMPENHKKEMKRYVIDLFPNKTIQEKLEACKIIYTLGSML